MKFKPEYLPMLFAPTFCVVDLDNTELIPITRKGYPVPTKIIKSPSGFHLYFEDIPRDPEAEKVLALEYGGDLHVPQRIFREGSTIEGGFTYRSIAERR